ncbi:hypothetical protein Pcinc_011872 [Petrolisthes cinctipes]|uniref:Uncharacterized protein n=1 Tax=Petrolisthes cinctipes TaxID=88211 RepID=A0AAE1KT24_PETCI|nr:hypothetical protein Pcinc_011872 [Petrolisthes cinctipes]
MTKVVQTPSKKKSSKRKTSEVLAVSSKKTIRNFPGLADVLGELGATEADLLEAAKPFFLALYDQPPRTSMESARFMLFTKKKKKSLKVMALPPTSANLL